MRARRACLACAILTTVTACGGPAASPPVTPSTTAAPSPAPAPKAVEPEPPAAAPEPAAAPAPEPPPAKEAEPEPCQSGWVCVKVPIEGARKVEKRPTQLIGDPKIAQTWSKTTDDAKGAAAFDFVAGRVVEIALKRKPNHKNEIVLRTASASAPEKKTPDVVLDVHDGDDFTYIGLVAAEKDGAILVDIRYMK